MILLRWRTENKLVFIYNIFKFFFYELTLISLMYYIGIVFIEQNWNFLIFKIWTIIGMIVLYKEVVFKDLIRLEVIENETRNKV